MLDNIEENGSLKATDDEMLSEEQRLRTAEENNIEANTTELIQGKDTKIPERYLKYLLKDGYGPWSKEPNHSMDNKRLQRLGKEIIYVNPPTEYAKNIVDMGFYRSYDQKAYFLDQIYNFDYYFARNILTHEDTQGVGDEERINEINQGNIGADNVLHGLTRNLSRMEDTANEGDEETMDSLTFLHNVAKDGKKIAVIESHGCTGYAPDGSELWIMGTHNGEVMVSADLVLSELAKKLDPDKYGAIYIATCNPDGLPVNMESVNIPVVASAAINDPRANPTKIYWPKSEASSAKI